jgi:hypothetical protein
MFAETLNPPRPAAATSDNTVVAGAASAAVGAGVSAAVSDAPFVGGLADGTGGTALHPSIAAYQYAPQVHPDALTAIAQPSPDRNCGPEGVFLVNGALDGASAAGNIVFDVVAGAVKTAGDLASSAVEGVSEIGSAIFSAAAEAVAVAAIMIATLALFCSSTPFSYANSAANSRHPSAANLAPADPAVAPANLPAVTPAKPVANPALDPALDPANSAALAPAPANPPITLSLAQLEIHSYQTDTERPTAQITRIASGKTTDFLLLNAGYRQKFRPGMNCEVLKSGAPIATLVIADSTLENAVALLTSTLPKQTTLAVGDTVQLKLISL